jgi:hypothetical protein
VAETIQQGIIPRQFEIFAGLDVDKSRIAVTFTDHERLLKSLQMPYSSECGVTNAVLAVCRGF